MPYKISIVTVVFNAVNSIEKTTRSIISQTYPDKEFIIIDGKSTDGTLEIINKYNKNIEIFVSEPDKGIYDAMNKAINRATGDWIIFMNAGDYFYDRHTLSAVFASETKYDNIDVLYGNAIMQLGDYFYQLPPTEHTKVNFHDWETMPFSHQAAFVKSSLLKRHHFACKYRIVGDLHLFRTLAFEGCKFQYLRLPICRCNCDGVSSTDILLSLRETAEICHKHSLDWRTVSKYKIRAWFIRNFAGLFRWQRNYRLRHNPKYPESDGLKLIEDCLLLNLPENPPPNALAPIALFCYNRLACLQRTVAALQKNELANKSQLFIFADGSKNTDDHPRVEAVRAYLKTITGFSSIKIFESAKNKGLANSIIDGVTQIVHQFGKIIVIEDDIITLPYFLQWMNDAISYYENNRQIAGVHAWCPPMNGVNVETFFIREVGCWGWATWTAGWKLFNADGRKLLEQIKNQQLCSEFDVYDSYPYCTMLSEQIQNKVDSWAIRWYASVFLSGKLGVHPGRSLVENIGFDSGTHFDGSQKIVQQKMGVIPPILGIDIEKFSADVIMKTFVPYNKKIMQKHLLSRIIGKLDRTLKNFFCTNENARPDNINGKN